MNRTGSIFSVPLTVWALAALLASGPDPVSAAGEVTWTGCGVTKKAFMEEIAAGYEAKTGVRIALSGGGATLGIRTVSAATSDMGGTCRHALMEVSGDPIPEEADAVLTQVAWDAIVVIVHPSNPVDDISLADLKQVYEGRMTSWSELGGSADRIALVAREGAISGVGHMFRHLVFGDPYYEFGARAFRVKSSGPLERKVEGMAAAMAIDGVSSARKSDVKILSIDGVAPTRENIASGTYPLFRPLFISTQANASPEIQAVLDYILSPEGQEVISNQGTVNLEEGMPLAARWASIRRGFAR